MDTALLLKAEEVKMSQDHEVILADHKEPEPGIITGLHSRNVAAGGLALGECGSDEIRNVIYTILMTKVMNLHLKILLFSVSSGIGHLFLSVKLACQMAYNIRKSSLFTLLKYD